MSMLLCELEPFVGSCRVARAWQAVRGDVGQVLICSEVISPSE